MPPAGDEIWRRWKEGRKAWSGGGRGKKRRIINSNQRDGRTVWREESLLLLFLIEVFPTYAVKLNAQVEVVSSSDFQYGTDFDARSRIFTFSYHTHNMCHETPTKILRLTQVVDAKLTAILYLPSSFLLGLFPLERNASSEQYSLPKACSASLQIKGQDHRYMNE